MQQQKAPDGTITGVVGSAGSGKTGWLKQQIAGASRLLVWDIEGQYTDRTRTIRTRAELVRAIQVDGRYSYQPATLQDFDFWARCAFVFCRIGAEAGQKTAIVAEELADVTSPGKAPDGWGMLVRRCRKYGGDVYGITQRPAESDKTLFGNAMVLHVCGMQRANDRAYMARELDVPTAAIAALDRSRLEYIHKDMRTGELTRGRLTF